MKEGSGQDDPASSPDLARFRPGITKGLNFGNVRVAVGADDWGKPRWPEMSAVLCGNGIIALRTYTRADRGEWLAAIAQVERDMAATKEARRE